MAANRPDEQLGPTTRSRRSSCEAADGVDADRLAAEIDDAAGGAHRDAVHHEAIDAIPGVRQQRSTFNQIIGVTIAIAAVVVALFFALLTVERLALYGVLKAIGARSRTLFAGLVAQAVVVTTAASIVAGDRRVRDRRAHPGRFDPARHLGPPGDPQRRPPPRRRHRRLRLLPPPGAPRRPGRRDRNRLMTKNAILPTACPTTIAHHTTTRPAAATSRQRSSCGVRKVYPMGDEEVVALDHADLPGRARRDRRTGRSVGLGQDDAVLDRRRAPHPHRGHRRRRR